MKRLLLGLFLVAYVGCLPHDLFQYFTLVDQDNDARLNPDELIAFAKLLDDDDSDPAEAALASLFAHYDTNGDGILSWDEYSDAFSTIQPENEEHPQQVHLMDYGLDQGMVVMWVTDHGIQASPVGSDSSSYVLFGTSEHTLSNKQLAEDYTYNVGIGGWHGLIHRASLTPLQVATKYYYQVVSNDRKSDVFSFTTDTPSTITRVAAFGDMGTTIPLGFAVAKQMAEDNLDDTVGPFNYALVIGDLAYAGTGGTDELQFIWDMWGRQMAPLASLVPLATTVGNHEKYYNFTSFRNRFQMPGIRQAGASGNFWFSFDRGLTHVLSMDSEGDYSPGSVQYQFLEKDLQTAVANRHIRPWIIVSSHRPMYASDVFENDQARWGAPLQHDIEPLLHKYNVDFFLAGHHHVYERTYPIDNGTVAGGNLTLSHYTNPKGFVHVLQGTGGSFYDNKWLTQPNWSAVRTVQYGYGHMTFFNSTTMRYQFRTEHNRSILDEFWISKPPPV